MMVKLQRRTGETWQTDIFTEPSEQCAFASVGLTMSLSDIYRNVRLDEAMEA